MASEVITTAILVIAGVIATAIVISSVYSQVYTLNSLIRINTRIHEDIAKTSIRIVHTSFNKTVDNSYLVVLVKNTGLRSIAPQELTKTDVYIGNENCNMLYLYDFSSQSLGSWSYTLIDLNSDGMWNPGETVILRVHNKTSLFYPICVKVVLPNGVDHEVYAYG